MNKTLRLNSLKATTAINAKISVFAISVEAIIYLLLYNLHDDTFKNIDHSITSLNTKVYLMVKLDLVYK